MTSAYGDAAADIGVVVDGLMEFGRRGEGAALLFAEWRLRVRRDPDCPAVAA